MLLGLSISYKLSSWAVDPTEIFFTTSLFRAYPLTFRTAFSPFSVAASMLLRALKIGSAKVCSVLLDAIHNRGRLTALPHFSRCASRKVLNVTEYFMYFLHYRNCFWVFVHDSVTFKF
jgi:hypothetical protein